MRRRLVAKSITVSKSSQEPDHTAVRVALWRALHALVDATPHVLEDVIGLKLIDPPASWRQRGDMEPVRMARTRASIVARARVVEDLVAECVAGGIAQYVILGAGLDTFVQRQQPLAAKLEVYEVEQPVTQEWKRKRLIDCGFGVPDNLHLVSVDFEANQSWLEEITRAGFVRSKPAIIASTGVAMYLAKETVEAMLREIAGLAPGSTFVMSFIRPLELVEPEERPGVEMAMKGAAAAGTPFLSFFAPEELLDLARKTGFKKARHVGAADLEARYFRGRTDGLRPSSGEELLVATT